MTYDELAALRDAAPQGADAEARYRAALAATIGDLDPAVPLLLLPIRLETRFRPSPPGRPVELLIRVYPDDVQMDGHEAGLTADDVKAGEHFWRTTWAATTEAERVAAWRQLADRLGDTRAAFVMKVLTPSNDPQAGQPPSFPVVAPRPSRWSRAVRAQGLPDRWIATAYRDGRKIGTAEGGLIARPLAAGPSPVAAAGTTDPGMLWMVDFAAAQTAGMGLVMSLDPALADRIDLLLVAGVRGSETALSSAATWTDLLDAHRYTWGLDLIAVGTPTNNTTGERSGQPARTSVPQAVAPASESDAAMIAAAFGITGTTRGPFGTIAHADLRDQADAADMASALWPATWGYFLAQMLRPEFTAIDLDLWRRWFVETVRARGPLPALRVGDQPYGVLPVTSLERWQPHPDQPELLVLQAVGGGRRSRTVLKVLWDLQTDGAYSDAPPPLALTLPARAVATALTQMDLDGDGQPELIVGWIEPGTSRAGYSVLRLEGAGTAVSRARHTELTLDEAPDRLALAAATLPDLGRALVLVTQQAGGRGRGLRLRIGTGLRATGAARQWSDPVSLRGIDRSERLLGIAVEDLNADGLPELVLLTDASATVQYRSGRGSLSDADIERWSAPVEVTSGGVAADAGGIAFADVDGDGTREVVVHYAWDGGGVAAGAYRVGSGLDPAGAPARWGSPFNAGAGGAGLPLGAGIVVSSVGRGNQVGWTTTAGRINLLRRLAEDWRRLADAVPRIGSGDVDRTLLDLLATDGTSASVAVRSLIGPALAESLWFALGDPLAATYRDDLDARLAQWLNRWAVAGRVRLGACAYADQALDFEAPLVSAGAEDEPVEYLAKLAAATPQDLHDGWTADDTPLLARLVRHSLLQAYADAAFALVPIPDPPLPEPELVDLADIMGNDPVTTRTLTSWRHLSEAMWQGRPVAPELYAMARTAAPRSEVAPLAATIAAVERLARRPAATLQRLMMEALDLSTHRLDAWITAVATGRLHELRADSPEGLHLGGYGLVTDLRPATAPPSTGYVHAPSLSHAATAAVLRSGYLTHGSSALAVDLSSTRARLALDLLDGVRSGQTLGALLGYRFERALAERRLLQHLPALRQLAPEAVGHLTPAPAGTAIETLAGLATVDGVVLLRKWKENAIPWGGTVPGQPDALPARGTADYTGVLAALAVVQDAIDAVGDVGLAESVHQALQGNYIRAGSALDGLARGDVPPPDPAVLQTPRTGIGVTWRLLVMTGGRDEVTALRAWTATAAQRALWIRAQAEPRLNGWAAQALGDPARVQWRVVLVDPETGEPTADGTRDYTLADAGLCPLDILYGPSPDVAALAETDLGRRLLLYAAAETAALRPAVPRLLPDRSPDWTTDVLSLAEILTVAEIARELVGGTRAADARDLAPAGLPGRPGVRQAEIDGRVTSVTTALTGAVSALKAAFAINAADVGALRAVLRYPDLPGNLSTLLDLPSHLDIGAACDELGVPALGALDDIRDGLALMAAAGLQNAAPRSIAVGDEAARRDLAAQARDVVKEAAARLSTAAAADTAAGGIEALIGRGFRVLPVFAVAQPADLDNARTVRRTAGDATPIEVEDWLDGVARVRAPSRRLHDVRVVAGAVAGEPPAPLQAVQLPAPGPPRWVGAAMPAGTAFPAGVTGLVLAAAEDWDPAADQAGLVVDEWVEVVPNAQETTGVVFHYDAPGSCAPQALLLAVSPNRARKWDADLLERILLETYDLTRMRSVQPHDLRGVGHAIPALFFARNTGGDPAGDTIATLFRK